MAEQNFKPRKKAASANFLEKECADDVGYKSPPKHTRYKKGQSGNPNGRPLGSKSLRGLVYEKGEELIELQISGKKRKMTRREVAVEKYWQQLLEKGDLKFFKHYFEIDDVMQQKRKAIEEKLNNGAFDLKCFLFSAISGDLITEHDKHQFMLSALENNFKD